MELKNAALRAQDFHEALKETTAFGPTAVHFRKTLLIGKVATLAMHFKGLPYIQYGDSLLYAAAELGIRDLELPAVLRELEVVDFVRVIKSGDDIKRVDIRVPEFRDGYEELSNRWTELKPTETEQAGILTLNQLLTLPGKESDLAKLGLDSTELSILKDVMEAGQLLRTQAVSGDRFIYSPLAVDANPIAYLEWANKYSDSVAKLLETLTANQGFPLSSFLNSDSPVVSDAILTGVVMPVIIQGSTGKQEFIFAPRGGLQPEERTIMEKARSILASVRYGQNFAAGRPINYPRAILRKLRDNKRFGKGHPDLHTQYSLLTEKLIGRPVKEGFGWNFEIIDTPENMKALDIAIDMLEIGESPTVKLNIEAQKALLSPHGYLGPTSARPRLAQSIHGSAETQADILRKLTLLTRGVDTDV
ncbi:MAG: hypothetical protein KME26_09120 [Oscillatoria princeps RMCB-10]|nr:hypothetical protein [Oscillatoria princeps RMCB-10]